MVTLNGASSAGQAPSRVWSIRPLTKGEPAYCRRYHELVPGFWDAQYGIYFDFNESSLEHAHAGNDPASPTAKKQIDEDLESFKSFKVPDDRIQVIGFADYRGSAAYNRKLAFRRARAVRDYLVEKGINPKRIHVHSFGSALSRFHEAQNVWLDRNTDIIFLRTYEQVFGTTHKPPQFDPCSFLE